MNIFWLATNYEESARYHHDKHVVKMVLEAAQIASTALYLRGVSVDGIYKPTHTSHPVVRWAADSFPNLYAVCRYGYAVGGEYAYRYGKQHKSIDVLSTVALHTLKSMLLPAECTPPPACMPDHYKTDSIIESYRAYYRAEKISGARWTKRESPWWL